MALPSRGLWVLGSISEQLSTGIDHVDTYGVAWPTAAIALDPR